MEYVFYLVIFAACIYVITGIVHSTLLSAIPIDRRELPSVVEREIKQFFPEFTPKSIKLQKARQRYELEGSYAGKPSQVTFALTPEKEVSIVEYKQVAYEKPFVKLNSISNAQIPAKLANKLQPYFGDDQTIIETSKAARGIIGDLNAYRIEIDSKKYNYRFDITDTGELFKFSKKEAA